MSVLFLLKDIPLDLIIVSPPDAQELSSGLLQHAGLLVGP